MIEIMESLEQITEESVGNHLSQLDLFLKRLGHPGLKEATGDEVRYWNRLMMDYLEPPTDEVEKPTTST